MLSPANLDRSFPQYLATQHLLINAGRRSTSSLAGAYYTAHRKARDVSNKADIRYVDPIELERTARALLVTGPVTVKRSIARGNTINAAMSAGEFATLGAVFRLVADGGRDTIRDTARADPEVLGFARVTDGDPCAFCAMTASRGFVYKSEESAGGEYHDRCGCFAEPAYHFDDPLPGKSQEFSDLWEETTGDFTGQDKANAFRRAYDAKRR